MFSISKADSTQLAGGKAAALGRMIRAGFTVPNGFVLSTKSFNAPGLEELILGSFDELQAEFVAVRSSAVGEDSAEAAWAGQLDTFLNCNRENLLQHIEKCWQSAGSARAQAYAEQKMIPITSVAVIVQEMIQSEVSGVAFSVHPVSGDNRQIVIEAGWGLGEAVVSGHITPDTYIVDKKTGQPIEKHVAQQEKMLVRSAAGETAWRTIEARGNTQKLSDEQISELARVVAKLEAFFTFPVDVEWAFSNNKLYILQSRPITTL